MEKNKVFFNGDFSEFSQENGFKGWEWSTSGEIITSCVEGIDGKNAVQVKYTENAHPHQIIFTNTDEARCELAGKLNDLGEGDCKLSCYFKAADEESVGKKIKIKMFYCFKNDNLTFVDRVDNGASFIELSNDWQKSECVFHNSCLQEKSITGQELDFVAVEIAIEKGESINACIADIAIEKVSELVVKEEPLHKLIPQDKTLIGAIRWDIWYETHSAREINQIIAEDEEYNKQNGTKRSRVTSPDMMMRTLSYYPFRAPYFVEYEGAQDNGDVKMSIKSCFEKTGLTYQYEDVMDDLKVKEHPYIYGIDWETEAKLAMDAGIDYFAYLYKGYNNTNFGQVLEPCFAHTATNGMLPDGRQMKMVCVMQDNHGGIADLDDFETDEEKMASIIYPRRMIYQAMAQSCYLDAHTVSGDIPIMHFYYDEFKRINTSDVLPLYIKEAKFFTEYLHKKNPDKYRVVDDIYFVGYTSCSSIGGLKSEAYYRKSLGYDALSKYAESDFVWPDDRKKTVQLINEQFDNIQAKGEKTEVGPLLPKGWDVEWYRVHRIDNCYDTKPSIWKEAFGATYERFMRNIEPRHRAYLDAKDIIDYIPVVSLGYNVTPRIKTRVSWCQDYGCGYLAYGTAKQQAQHLKNTLEYMLEYKKANPNTVNMIDIYAWNEHDEGGYLCPAVAVDEHGEPILNGDGTVKMDSSILDECAKVIKEFRVKEAANK